MSPSVYVQEGSHGQAFIPAEPAEGCCDPSLKPAYSYLSPK